MLRRYVALAVFVVVSGSAFGQTARPPQTKRGSALAAKAARAAKLTPQQQQGLRLLKTAEVEARAMEPESRAVLLLEVAAAYEKRDPRHHRALVREAFETTITLPDTGDPYSSRESRVKMDLQVKALSTLCRESPEGSQDLLPQAMPAARQQADSVLVQALVDRKRFSQAREILRRRAAEDDYPYLAAMTYLLSLPPSQVREELVHMFEEALTNFREFSPVLRFGSEDLTTFVIRLWRYLPSPTVLDAIDAILEHAKTEDFPNLSLTTPKGSLSFPSMYQYRLFSLLPVLQELDSAKAESLLKNSPETAAAIKRFPQGLVSTDSSYGTEDPRKFSNREAVSINFGTMEPADAQNVAFHAEMEKAGRGLATMASKNPHQAYEQALGLPLWGPDGREGYSPRAEALMGIASEVGRKDENLTRQALTDAAKVIEDISPTVGAYLLRRIIEIRLQIGDNDGAEKLIRVGARLAEKLYERDTNPDDPNQAPKLHWLSTAFWRRLVNLAGKLSPQFAEEIAGEPRDPEIKTFEQVVLARTFLEGTAPPMVARDTKQHLDSAWNY